MQCTIYAPGELAKKRIAGKNRVLVLARWEEGLILSRDELNALWALPQGEREKGEGGEEAARRALGAALGEAVFDVSPLCEFTITDEAGKESGGCAYLADVREWPARGEGHARAFVRMPLGSQTAQAALVFGLHRWAGVFFDERLDLQQLGSPGIR